MRDRLSRLVWSGRVRYTCGGRGSGTKYLATLICFTRRIISDIGPVPNQISYRGLPGPLVQLSFGYMHPFTYTYERHGCTLISFSPLMLSLDQLRRGVLFQG